MKRALVTGGAGFIGSSIVRALRAADHAVHVAGKTSDDPLTAERVATLGELDVIVHCAGGASVGASLQDPLADFEKSVPPLARILDHVRTRSPGAQVVLLSSAAVYGAAEAVPTPETAPLAPVSPYGVHKKICEDLCRSYGRSYGVASVVVRLFSVYGPELRKQLLWDACTKARAGDVTFAGTGDELRDWLHVEDATSLVRAVIDRASPDAPVFNGGTGRGTSVRDVVTQICDELGAGAPKFTGAVRAGDPPRYIADTTRARATGWVPAIDRVAGIASYVAWFREQG